MPEDQIDPPFDSFHDALTAWIEHDRSHAWADPACARCRELDAIVTRWREVESEH